MVGEKLRLIFQFLQVLLAVEAPTVGATLLTPTIPEEDVLMENLLKIGVSLSVSP